MIPRAVRPTLASTCAAGLPDARRAAADMRADDGDIDRIRLVTPRCRRIAVILVWPARTIVRAVIGAVQIPSASNAANAAGGTAAASGRTSRAAASSATTIDGGSGSGQRYRTSSAAAISSPPVIVATNQP